MTAGDILPEAVYLGGTANANSLTAHCTLGQGSNYPNNGFWYIYQSDYNSTNKKQIALAYKTYTIMIRQMVDGAWTDWHSVLTNADMMPLSVANQFTGSANCEVLGAYRSGNIVQLWVSLKNITQGWTDFALTTKCTIASGTATPGIVHRSAASDSTAQISCTYNGAKVTTLSSSAAGVSAGVVALFLLIVK